VLCAKWDGHQLLYSLSLENEGSFVTILIISLLPSFFLYLAPSLGFVYETKSVHDYPSKVDCKQIWKIHQPSIR